MSSGIQTRRAIRFTSLHFALLHFASLPLPRRPRHLPEGSAFTTAGPGGLCSAAGHGRGASRRLTGEGSPGGRPDSDPGPGPDPDPDPGPQRRGAPGSASPAARSEELQLRGGTGRGREGQSPPG